jgi:hypothetical protein
MTTTPAPAAAPANPPAAPWYALVVMGSAGFLNGRRRVPEFAAVEAIGDEGHTAFVPVERYWHHPQRHSHKRVRAFRPMFPGYVFAQLSRIPSRADVRRWAPAYDLVRFVDRPAIIPLHAIALLETIGGITDPFDSTGHPTGEAAVAAVRLVAVGDTVEHRGTSLDGRQATVLEVGKRQAVLLMPFLGSLRRTRVALAELEIVDKARVP